MGLFLFSNINIFMSMDCSYKEDMVAFGEGFGEISSNILWSRFASSAMRTEFYGLEVLCINNNIM